MGRDSTLSSDAGHLTGRAVTGGAVTGGVISGGRPRFGSGLFAYELRVLFGRLRTRALLLVLAGVPVLIAVAVKLSAHPPRPGEGPPFLDLSLIHISEPTRLLSISYAVFCLKKNKQRLTPT